MRVLVSRMFRILKTGVQDSYFVKSWSPRLKSWSSTFKTCSPVPYPIKWKSKKKKLLEFSHRENPDKHPYHTCMFLRRNEKKPSQNFFSSHLARAMSWMLRELFESPEPICHEVCCRMRTCYLKKSIQVEIIYIQGHLIHFCHYYREDSILTCGFVVLFVEFFQKTWSALKQKNMPSEGSFGEE